MQQALIFQSTSRLLEAISYTLQQLTDSTSKTKCAKTIFNSCGSVSASIPAYLLRLFRYLNCSNSCFIIALILLDRLQLVNPVFVLNHRNVHKLLVTAILISIKSYDDQFYKQDYYAKVAGLKLEELNALQITFLTNLQFSTFVTSETFNTYAQKLEEVLGDSKRKMKKEKSSEDLSTVGSRCSEDHNFTKQREELDNSFSSNKN